MMFPRKWIHATVLTLAIAASALAGGVEDAVKDLGNEDWKKREAATTALSAMGDEAVSALEKAAKDKDPEVRWRAERALQSIRARGGKPASKRDESEKAQEKKPGAAEGAKPAPALVPDALDRAREQLRSVEEEMKRQRPELGEMLKGFGGLDLFGGDLGKMLEEMERRLRDLDPSAPRGRNPGMRRDFWSFRFDGKNGTWELVRPDAADDGIGVEVSEVPPVLRAQLRLEAEPGGCVIELVQPGSLAEKAGLARYDVVLRVDGAEVAVADADALDALTSPGEHRLAIVRAGERKELAYTTPAEAPAAAKKAEAPPAAAPEKPAPPKPAEPPKAEKKDDGLRRY